MNMVNSEHYVKLFDLFLAKHPEIEKTAQRVNEGLATFGERMRKKDEEAKKLISICLFW
jgi:hypothetical protein